MDVVQEPLFVAPEQRVDFLHQHTRPAAEAQLSFSSLICENTCSEPENST